MNTLHLVFGPQGAGKSTHALALARSAGALRLSLDAWVHRLFGPDMPSRPDFAWVMARVARCEAQLWATAVDTARAGLPVILDVGALRATDRQRYAEQAAAAALPLTRHFVTADAAVRRQRVMARNQARGETFSFEVTPGMFAMMESVYEAPAPAELDGVTVTDTTPGARP